MPCPFSPPESAATEIRIGPAPPIALLAFDSSPQFVRGRGSTKKLVEYHRHQGGIAEFRMGVVVTLPFEFSANFLESLQTIEVAFAHPLVFRK